MVLLKPFVVLIALFLFYIPPLRFLGLGLIFFIYHVLIKNRAVHINYMKKIYKEKNLKFPELKKDRIFLWFILYVISFSIWSMTLYTIANEMYLLNMDNVIEQMDFIIPVWQRYLVIISFIAMWITYANLINKLIKDQWILQESEYNNNLIKNRPIKLRDGHMVMLLRFISFNFYEWYLLFILLKEIGIHYLEDKSAYSGMKLIYNNRNQKENYKENNDVKQENIIKREENLNKINSELSYQEMIDLIKNIDENEKFSIIFSKVTKLKKDKAINLLDKLESKGYISEDEKNKIISFF